MDRKKFGKLIIALRRERLDRHFTSWTRQKFSEESGIDQEILTNIETGRRAILYPDLLIKMANALMLTSGERREFFLAASGVDEQAIYHPRENPRTALENMLAIMDDIQQPAFLIDSFFDLVAINQMALEIYNVNITNFLDSQSNPKTRYNLIRLLFSSEFDEQKTMFGKSREKFAMNTIMLFRTTTLRYRASEYFQYLYPHLYEIDDFKNYIHYLLKDDDYMNNNMFITLNNPRIGSVQSVCTSLSATSTHGELRLLTFTPLSEETSKIFANLAQQGNFVFQTLPDWPDKSKII